MFKKHTRFSVHCSQGACGGGAKPPRHPQIFKGQESQGPMQGAHTQIFKGQGSQGPMRGAHTRIFGSQGPMPGAHTQMCGSQGPMQGAMHNFYSLFCIISYYLILFYNISYNFILCYANCWGSGREFTSAVRVCSCIYFFLCAIGLGSGSSQLFVV